jgi:hypothetical protein
MPVFWPTCHLEGTHLARLRTDSPAEDRPVTQTKFRESSVAASPVSDVTYDLMQALTSKLEAIEAYELYREDAQGDVRQLFDDLLVEDRSQAERLLEALRIELR